MSIRAEDNAARMDIFYADGSVGGSYYCRFTLVAQTK